MAAASTDLLGAMAAGKDGSLVIFVALISLDTYHCDNHARSVGHSKAGPWASLKWRIFGKECDWWCLVGSVVFKMRLRGPVQPKQSLGIRGTGRGNCPCCCDGARPSYRVRGFRGV